MRNVVYFFGRNTVKRIIVKINWFITLVKGFLETNNCRIKIWWKHNELFTTGLQPTYVPLHHRRHTGNRWRGWEVMSLREDYSVSKTPYLLNIRTGLLVNWGGWLSLIPVVAGFLVLASGECSWIFLFSLPLALWDLGGLEGWLVVFDGGCEVVWTVLWGDSVCEDSVQRSVWTMTDWKVLSLFLTTEASVGWQLHPGAARLLASATEIPSLTLSSCTRLSDCHLVHSLELAIWSPHNLRTSAVSDIPQQRVQPHYISHRQEPPLQLLWPWPNFWHWKHVTGFGMCFFK